MKRINRRFCAAICILAVLSTLCFGAVFADEAAVNPTLPSPAANEPVGLNEDDETHSEGGSAAETVHTTAHSVETDPPETTAAPVTQPPATTAPVVTAAPVKTTPVTEPAKTAPPVTEPPVTAPPVTTPAVTTTEAAGHILTGLPQTSFYHPLSRDTEALPVTDSVEGAVETDSASSDETTDAPTVSESLSESIGADASPVPEVSTPVKAGSAEAADSADEESEGNSVLTLVLVFGICGIASAAVLIVLKHQSIL